MTDSAMPANRHPLRRIDCDLTANPFRASNLRPGLIPFLFHDDTNADKLLKRLNELGGTAEIRGPHGTGKSTLAAMLAAAWKNRGHDVVQYTLRQGERRLPLSRTEWIQRRSPNMVLVIDGAEQLRPWTRWLWMSRCRRNGCGLLMTTHHQLGVPTLWVTTATVESARRVIGEIFARERRLAADDAGGADVASFDPAPCDIDEIRNLLRQHKGNLREVLFSLYDRWHQRH